MPRIRATVAVACSLVLSLPSAVGVAAADPDTYDAALISGDLALLIPERFGDAEILQTGGPWLGPAEVDTPDAAAAREELLAIAADAGTSLEEVAVLSGFLEADGAFSSFTATRIPGVAAVDWFEPYFRIGMVRSYSDPVRKLVAVGPKQVLRIADRGSSRSDLVHAQGEVLWVLSGDDDLGIAFIGDLETVEGPALTDDPGALVDGEPVAVIGSVDDPVSQIPAQILGAATSTQTFPAAAVIENVDSSDPENVAMAERFRALLDGAGGVDRATIISSQARADDGGIVIVGLHVDGADHAAFRDGFLELFLLTELDEPLIEQARTGGKDVLRISEAGSISRNATTVYGVGGTVWMLTGQEEYVAALLRTMP